MLQLVCYVNGNNPEMDTQENTSISDLKLYAGNKEDFCPMIHIPIPFTGDFQAEMISKSFFSENHYFLAQLACLDYKWTDLI
jgi:hypothetical protein